MDQNKQMRLYAVSDPIVSVISPAKHGMGLVDRLLRKKVGYSNLAVIVKYDLSEIIAFDPNFQIEDWLVDFVLYLEPERYTMVRAFNIHIGGQDDRYTCRKYLTGNEAIFEVYGSPRPVDDDLFDILSNEARTCSVTLVHKNSWEIIASDCVINNVVSEKNLSAKAA